MRSWTDYLLGTDHHLFQNISVWDPQHNYDHYIVLGCLRRAAQGEHSHYLDQRQRLPLLPPQTKTQEDQSFIDLRRAIPKTSPQERQRN